MQVTHDKSTRFADELRITPWWAVVLAAIGFVCAQLLFNVSIAREANAPPIWGRILLGLVLGAAVACYFLFIGYVNRDAGRRGMSRVLWTIVAIFVPNGLGIVLYFILRQPLTARCPQCGAAVQSGFRFCPRCSTRLHPGCPHCQREVQTGDKYCPYCGGTLAEQESRPTEISS
ncbi:MAG TPA: zinc ribbon domain-containing protein [Terriglobales bacterium]|jgi:RNA polymerase subunit RPABC4/transcription elongation factor Spt4|nr:zinc ribbon domain-containing protein [Terriglobales bacterium]